MQRTLAIVLVSLSGTLAAQNCIHVPNANPGAGLCYLIPFGSRQTTSATWSNQRYQSLIPSSYLPKKSGRIQELGFAACATADRHFASIVIRMAQTKSAVLSTSFAQNLGSSAVTVLDARNHVWYVNANQWDHIGLQKPFPYDPGAGNLVIDVEVRGAGAPNLVGNAGFRTADLQRVHALGWKNAPPERGQFSSVSGLRVELCFDVAATGTFGVACPGSNGLPALKYTGASKLGSTVHVALLNAPKTLTAAVLLIGFDNSPPFPIELTGAGGPGCRIYHDIVTTLVSATINGTATYSIGIPNSTRLLGGRFYNQAFVLDFPANRLGWTSSNYGRVLIGN